MKLIITSEGYTQVEFDEEETRQIDEKLREFKRSYRRRMLTLSDRLAGLSTPNAPEVRE